MKKAKFIGLAAKAPLFSFIFLAAGFLNAQEFTIPKPVDLFQHSVSSGAIYEFPIARIWGWSAAGKVAYSIEREVEGRGGKIINFTVFDTVSDDVVVSFGIDTFDIGDDNLTSEYLYSLLRDRITNAIRANSIVGGGTDFRPFPIRRNNMEYSCSITNIVHSADNYGFFNDNVSKYTVVVTANGKSKVVNTFESDALTRKIYICGYILSPFENRALIVLAEENFVFEGTELFYIFGGCHLGTGFN